MPDILKNLFIDRQHRHDVTICSNQIPVILEVKTLHGNHHLFNNKVTFFSILMNYYFHEISAQPKTVIKISYLYYIQIFVIEKKNKKIIK